MIDQKVQERIDELLAQAAVAQSIIREILKRQTDPESMLQAAIDNLTDSVTEYDKNGTPIDRTRELQILEDLKRSIISKFDWAR